MPLTQEGYRDYLLARPLAVNTVNSYCSGINHLNLHSGQDLWTITDLGQLDTLLADYGLDGQLSEVGSYGNGTARNALRQWRDYVAHKTGEIEAQPATYLLTWNPDNYQDGGNAGVRVGENERWTCHSTKPQPGDRVYLIRLGGDPRGMVARGTVTKGSFEDADWRDPSKTRRYIEFRAEETRPDCATGLLPMVLLEQISKGSFKWSAQSSGISVPPALAKQLDTLWEAGREVHSLAQCANWFQAQAEWYNDSWKPHYLARVDAIEAIKSGQQALDDATLDWLWREGNNGVCTVSPGHLPNAEYEQNIGLLRELATLVLQDPGRGTYEHVFDRWNAAKEEGLFRQTYTAVIHRVFAAAAPERYTTLVNVQHCRILLKRFTRDFELQTVESRDWLELNNAIKRAMQEVGVPDSTPIDNNILAWMLYETFSKPSTETGSGSTQPTFPPQNNLEEPIVTGKAPLNQILFGPPGTGKTYHTIDKALSILEPTLLATPGVTRAELKAAFTRYQEGGQVAFVTFHQSFSYEDFVEGIRAESREDGTLEYKVEPGVFAKLCERAGRGTDQDQQALGEQIEQSDEGRYPTQYEAKICSQRKPFVLIIDEINRGNVSRIFGELITLIEPSKRDGASEALSTILPYSKRPFSVPDNLYLIGTMNTADRSLAGLDIALRRRFVFEEMPPRPELLDGVVIEEEDLSVNVGELLSTLNQRIELLLDRDHCLGHANFMPLKEEPTLERLSAIFQNQVLPLLQEYFFEDWQRIAWVLNDHRKSSQETMFLQAPKLDIKALLGDVPVGKQRQRWTLNPAAFGNITAYALTIAGDKGAQ